MPGKVKSPDGGTILLKNIDQIDTSNQAKFPQILGGNTISHSSVLIEGVAVNSVAPRVLLTIKDRLKESVKKGHFYDDFFSKIHFVSITVPPLKNRKGQIPSLSQYYFNFYKEKYGKDVSPFSSKIIDAFGEYDWRSFERRNRGEVRKDFPHGVKHGLVVRVHLAHLAYLGIRCIFGRAWDLRHPTPYCTRGCSLCHSDNTGNPMDPSHRPWAGQYRIHGQDFLV